MGADAAAARRRADAARRRLNELAEGQRWVHHVGDLSAGEIVSTDLDRPVTPPARARRLQRAGLQLTPPRFGGPSFRLTPRVPYQASPEAYLVAFNATIYLPFGDTIIWEVRLGPRLLPAPRPRRLLPGLPERLGGAERRAGGKARPGRTGSVELIAYRNAVTARIPIGEQFAAHTVDLAVPPPGPRFLDTTMLIGPGVELLKFSAVTFRAGIILDGVLLDA